ncbi:BofC C-terminal domain-containing protein [Pelosinus sp. sgz500959]|uniref:BofC C-terminal domain-containing protein n=1 Tax=Pelosinus sp. sgz500959 TaxID=3242472 RepID=UPI00366F830F
MLPFKKVNKKIVLLTTGMLLLIGMTAYYMAYSSFIGEERSLSAQETEVAKQDGKIKTTDQTDLVQRMVYLKCKDEEVLKTKPTEKLVGLTIYQLQKVYQGWVIDKFDSDEVDMTLKVDSYCREHANNMFIGIQDDKVAVFYGKPGPRSIVKEITSIQINHLMPQDIEELHHGIVVQSTEELLRTLEGMQSR